MTKQLSRVVTVCKQCANSRDRMAGYFAGHFQKWPEMAGHFWKWRAIPGNGWPFLEMAGHFWKWQAISGNGR